MVVAQLVEWLLLAPEDRGSNTVISKFWIEHLFIVNYVEKTKIKQKEADNGPLKKLKETKCESSLFYFFHGWVDQKKERKNEYFVCQKNRIE